MVHSNELAENHLPDDAACKSDVVARFLTLLDQITLLDQMSIGAERPSEPMKKRPIVRIMGSNTPLVNEIQTMIQGMDLDVAVLDSVAEIPPSYDRDTNGCVILTTAGETHDDLEVIGKLAIDGCSLPVIVVGEMNDADICRCAFRRGAFDFVRISENRGLGAQFLRKRVDEAIRKDSETSVKRRQRAIFADRLGQLTPREDEVLQLLVSGKSMKEIAMQFNISIQTAAKHRSALLAKLQVENDVQLVLSIISVRR